MQNFGFFEDIENFLKNIHLQKGKFSFTFIGKEKGKNKNYQADIITNTLVGKYQFIIDGVIQGVYSTKNDLLDSITTKLTELGFKSKETKVKVSNLDEKDLDFSLAEENVASKEYIQKFKGNNSDFEEYFIDNGINSIGYKDKNKKALIEMEETLSKIAFEKNNQKNNDRINKVKRYIDILKKSFEEQEFIDNLLNGKEEIFSSSNKGIEKAFKMLIDKSKENKSLIPFVIKINELFSNDKNALSGFEFHFDDIKKDIEEKGFLLDRESDFYISSILSNSKPFKLFEYGGSLESLFKMIKEKDAKDYEPVYAYKLRFDDYKYFHGNQQIVFKNEEDAIEKFKSLQNDFGQGEVGVLYKVKIFNNGVDTFGKEHKVLFTHKGLDSVIKKQVLERDYLFDRGGEEEFLFEFDRIKIYTKKTKTEIKEKFNNSTLEDFISYIKRNMYTKDGIEIIIV